MKKFIYAFILILPAGLFFNSCSEDYLDTYPTSSISANDVTLTTDNAWAALNGIHRHLYRRYINQGMGGLGGHYIVTDCQAEDHVNNASQWYREVYGWYGPRDATNRYCIYPWRMFYQWIANANVLINGIDDAAGPQEDKDAIKGQALLYRAFCHHRIVQAYAERYAPGGPNTQLGIPLMMTNTTEGQSRATVAEVYAQIHADLDEAITLLAGWSRPNKSHMNVDVANAIKARVSLTQGLWADAITYSVAARTGIGSYSLMDSATYSLGFRIDSESEGEYIWASQIQLDQTDKWANYGAYISRNFSSSAIRGNPRSISGWLYDQIPATDTRKGCFDDAGGQALTLPPGISLLGSHKLFPYTSEKFIAVDNGDSRVDVPHVRISELYLMEAEANARLGNDALAAAALYTMVVARDPSYTLSTNTGQALIDEIMIQRRIELWGEGFRWYDLKRLNLDLDRNQAGNHQVALAIEMFIPAGDVRWQWLIPKDEIDANPNLVQNPLN